MGPIGRQKLVFPTSDFASFVTARYPKTTICDLLYLQKMVEYHIVQICVLSSKIRELTMTFVQHALDDMKEEFPEEQEEVLTRVSKRLQQKIRVSPYHIQLVDYIQQ